LDNQKLNEPTNSYLLETQLLKVIGCQRKGNNYAQPILIIVDRVVHHYVFPHSEHQKKQT